MIGTTSSLTSIKVFVSMAELDERKRLSLSVTGREYYYGVVGKKVKGLAYSYFF